MTEIGKPHQPANFVVAIFSRYRNIKGEPPILGSSPSPEQMGDLYEKPHFNYHEKC